MQTLSRRGALDTIAAVALGYALVAVAGALGDVFVNVLSQYTSEARSAAERFPGPFTGSPYLLNFRIGDTLFFYGPVLGAVLAISLIASACFGYLRVRARTQMACPHCHSKLRLEATVCSCCLFELGTSEG